MSLPRVASGTRTVYLAEIQDTMLAEAVFGDGTREAAWLSDT
jgi:hypothetical protein